MDSNHHTKRVSFIRIFLEGLIDMNISIATAFLETPCKGFYMKEPAWKKYNGYSKKQFSQGIKNLSHRGIIKHENGSKYYFTKRGKRWLESTAIQYSKIKKVPWDRRWRLVLFDIPSKKNSERNRFRGRLKALGFFMIQKSAFVIPYPCEKEIGQLCKLLDISDCVAIITANSLGNHEDEAYRVFHL